MNISLIRKNYESKLQAMKDLLDKQVQRIEELEVENAKLKGANDGLRTIIEVLNSSLLKYEAGSDE